MFKFGEASSRRGRGVEQAGWLRKAGALIGLAALSIAPLSVAPVGAQQMENFDPDSVYSQESGDAGGIDGDLARPPERAAPEAPDTQVERTFPNDGSAVQEAPAEVPDWVEPGDAGTPGPEMPTSPAVGANGQTYGEDDLIGAAEGLFGEGAEGLARLIEDLLEDQGEPNGYIVGREAGGAFIFGARYGSGTLYHKVEGQRPVYWTGPSLGFDAGANAANTFVLVYNLYDSEEIFRRYPAGEGQAYFVGGLHASYMRRGDVVLIPIRMGAGLRLGVNAGYMRFSKKQRWLPF